MKYKSGVESDFGVANVWHNLALRHNRISDRYNRQPTPGSMSLCEEMTQRNIFSYIGTDCKLTALLNLIIDLL